MGPLSLPPQGLHSRQGLMHSGFSMGVRDLNSGPWIQVLTLIQQTLETEPSLPLNLYFSFHSMEWRWNPVLLLYEHSTTEPHPRLSPKLLIPKEKNWLPSLHSFCLTLRSFKGDTHPNSKPSSNETSQGAQPQRAREHSALQLTGTDRQESGEFAQGKI